MLSRSFLAGAGPDPTHDLPKRIRPECNSPHHLPGEGFNLRFGLAPFLRQSHPLTNDLWALLVFRFHARSLMLCATNFAALPAVAVKRARSASGERSNACQVRANLLRPSIVLLMLFLCRKRTICPRRHAASKRSPIAAALSKSSRWSFRGKVFHCMITAVPRNRKICSSCARRTLSDRLFCRMGWWLHSDVLKVPDGEQP